MERGCTAPRNEVANPFAAHLLQIGKAGKRVREHSLDPVVNNGSNLRIGAIVV